jgi:hypothetical protein
MKKEVKRCNRHFGKMEQTEILQNLAEQFLKMMQFNNHLLEENLKLMKRIKELEK